VQAVDLPLYSSSPTSFMTPAGLRRSGWQPRRAGWLIEMRQPPTGAQLAAARNLAAAAGLPLVAATGGWLLAGHQPPALARQPLE
jgi:putative ABC transport system permease protein